MNKNILQLKNGKVEFGGVRALDGADFVLRKGEIIAIMGPNGAGKSTLLKSMFGIAHLSFGEVFLRGKKINPCPHDISSAGVSFVPQGRRVFPSLTVEENLEVGALDLNKIEMKKKIEEVVEIFPALKEKKKQKSGYLSGGQQQMLAIARGLMSDPDVLLLDEPSLGLSPKLAKEVFLKIKEINDKRGIAVVIVEHNIKSVLSIADRGYVLDKGKVFLEDNAENILKGDVLEKVFLGKT